MIYTKAAVIRSLIFFIVAQIQGFAEFMENLFRGISAFLSIPVAGNLINVQNLIVIHRAATIRCFNSRPSAL